MFVLAVQLDQPTRQVTEGRRGGEGAVDERATPTLRRDLAPNQHVFPIAFEDRFDRRDVFSGADQIARRAAPEQQADGADQHRLSGTGLASQNVEAWSKLNLDSIDDRELLNSKKSQHWKRWWLGLVMYASLKRRATNRNFNRSIGLTGISRP